MDPAPAPRHQAEEFAATDAGIFHINLLPGIADQYVKRQPIIGGVLRSQFDDPRFAPVGITQGIAYGDRPLSESGQLVPRGIVEIVARLERKKGSACRGGAYGDGGFFAARSIDRAIECNIDGWTRLQSPHPRFQFVLGDLSLEEQSKTRQPLLQEKIGIDVIVGPQRIGLELEIAPVRFGPAVVAHGRTDRPTGRFQQCIQPLFHQPSTVVRTGKGTQAQVDHRRLPLSRRLVENIAGCVDQRATEFIDHRFEVLIFGYLLAVVEIFQQLDDDQIGFRCHARVDRTIARCRGGYVGAVAELVGSGNGGFAAGPLSSNWSHSARIRERVESAGSRKSGWKMSMPLSTMPTTTPRPR